MNRTERTVIGKDDVHRPMEGLAVFAQENTIFSAFFWNSRMSRGKGDVSSSLLEGAEA